MVHAVQLDGRVLNSQQLEERNRSDPETLTHDVKLLQSSGIVQVAC